MHRKKVNIVEVGPRDGLQNESVFFSTKEKAEFIGRMIKSGIRRLEVASFVHPGRVPAMADAEALLEMLPDLDDVSYIGLVLNLRGAERAVKTKVNEIGCVLVASETFGQKNQGQTIEEGHKAVADILEFSRTHGKLAGVTIAAAFGCPYEGEVPAARIIDIAQRVAESEPMEIALADTIGVGVPGEVRDLFGALKEKIPHIPLRGHFHNTRNTGIANAYAAFEGGAVTLDASLGGIGGCPFAPDATGNIATEDLIYLLNRSSVATGISLKSLIENSQWMAGKLGRVLPSLVSRAGDFPVRHQA
ncbi:MAG: hydroxymethylglutaryl-CoA lyase [Alphaproteobacteria bacterium]|nr:MAG: hydroxymethylglutaryl-CoA lyase [Alphaproteobacteria bacterium]